MRTSWKVYVFYEKFRGDDGLYPVADSLIVSTSDSLIQLLS